MSFLIILLIIGYISSSVKDDIDGLKYGLILFHTLTVALLLVNVKVSDPKLGLMVVGGFVSSSAVFISKKEKWKTMVSPLMGVVAILLTLSLLAPIPSNSPIEVQTWVALHIFLILMGYIGCIAAGLC